MCVMCFGGNIAVLGQWIMFKEEYWFPLCFAGLFQISNMAPVQSGLKGAILGWDRGGTVFLSDSGVVQSKGGDSGNHSHTDLLLIAHRALYSPLFWCHIPLGRIYENTNDTTKAQPNASTLRWLLLVSTLQCSGNWKSCFYWHWGCVDSHLAMSLLFANCLWR